jgi:hypothetical protein
VGWKVGGRVQKAVGKKVCDIIGEILGNAWMPEEILGDAA